MAPYQISPSDTPANAFEHLLDVGFRQFADHAADNRADHRHVDVAIQLHAHARAAVFRDEASTRRHTYPNPRLGTKGADVCARHPTRPPRAI